MTQGAIGEPNPGGQAAQRLYEEAVMAHVVQARDGLLPLGAGVGAGDAQELLLSVEALSRVDIDVPVNQGRAVEKIARRVLRPAMAWYFNYTFSQLNAMASDLTRLLRVTESRLAQLEGAAVRAKSVALDFAGATASQSAQQAMAAQVVEALEGVSGTILVAEACHGALLGALAKRGLDAYGVETRPGLVQELASAGLRIVEMPIETHLMGLRDGTLAALVLSGFTEREGAETRLSLLAQAKRVLAPGGILVVVSATIDSFLAGENHLERDLFPGRPFTPATWADLLGSFGLRTDEPIIQADGTAYAIRAHALPGTPGTASESEMEKGE